MYTERQTSQSAAKRFHLTASEIFEVLELARARSARNWCILVLALNHACRVSELAGGSRETATRPAVLPLRLADVEGNYITIRRLKGSLTTRQPFINVRGNPTVSDKAAVDAYLKERIDDSSGLFFTGQKGPLTRWTLEKMFRRYCKQVSGARVARGAQAIPESAMRFHSLKHTSISTMVQQGKNLMSVKDWAGHASISSTMLYAHPDARTTANYAQQAFSNAFMMVNR